MNNALIMVDLQNDFCEGGSLAVPHANEIIPLANQLQASFDCVIATKDWHPADHNSFASNYPDNKAVGDLIEIRGLQQVLWPDHCVQGTPGAEFHPDLNISGVHKIVLKGIDKTVDSYSAFYDNAHLRKTELTDYLLEKNINEIFIMGLATDYCVRFTCLDAIKIGFKTHIIQDACRGVELKKGDIAFALKEMQEGGVIIHKAKEFLHFNKI